MDDQHLLETYVRQRSDDALTRLVHRHVNLVYSAALRLVRDPHMAEDVTQTTFIALSHNARRLTGERVLSAWLLVTTRNAALDALKARSRRTRHEREAAQMAPTTQQPPDDSQWDQIAPHLDDALATLSADDRRAITLRYFEGCTAQQVAERLGVTPDSARQRVHRATLRMRSYFTGKGLNLTAEALGPLIATNAVHTAPPALAAATAKVLVATTHATVGASAAKGTAMAIAVSKAKALVVTIAAIALVGGSAMTVNRLAKRAHPITPVAMVQQVPTAPVIIPPSESSTVIGYAFNPDGKPAAGAEVVASTKRHYVAIWQGSTYSDGKPVPPFLGVGVIKIDDYLHFDYLDGQHTMPARDVTGWQGVTASDGRFELHLNQPASGVFIHNKFGGAIAAVADLPQNPHITLQPWSRIEGNVHIGAQSVPKASVTTENLANPEMLNKANIVVQSGALSDDTGHFAIPQAMPGATMIFRPHSMGPENKPLTRHGNEVDFGVMMPWHTDSHIIQIPPGTTVHSLVGGTGRPVVGHVTTDIHAFPFRRARFAPAPGKNRPIPYDVAIDISPQGDFRIDDLPPGSYHVRLETGLTTERWALPPRYRFLDLIATAERDFEIPPMDTPRLDEPLDLGAFAMTPLPHLETGKLAPDFASRTADGKDLKLSSLRGKFVLLQIGAKAMVRDRDTDRIIAIHDRFLTEPRFTMLSVDSQPPSGSKPEPEDALWLHATVPDIQADLPREYQNSGSSLYVFDPDGKFFASNLDGFGTYELLDRTLKPNSTAANVVVDHLPRASVSASTPFNRVPAPNLDNIARSASIRIVDGTRADNSGPPDRLVDGRMPATEDAPTQNFKFADSTLEGRVSFDLGNVVPISAINSYSWHKEKRAPQVYRVYGSDGRVTDFDPAPKNGIDPASRGWKVIADVDTRTAQDPPGGRYAVCVSAKSGMLGNYRYLLFVMFPAQTADLSGHTFYSEINVIERK